VLGDQGVGKTTLLQQFFTSEFMGNADLVFDKEYEKTVSVEIDGQETTVTFVDLPSNNVKILQIYKPQNSQQYSEIDAFIVCYSITDRQSFDFALSLLREFRHRTDTAVILVANKSDLVRSRKVTFEEGRSVCRKYNCKFIEVSAAFNHCVDDLLVGLVHQIRLNPSRQRAKSVPNTGCNMSSDALLSTKSSSSSSSSSHFSTSCFRGAKVFFAEFLFGFRKKKSRSCDNLWSARRNWLKIFF
ncbi:hypothetical protein HELRODRAFT_67160, partial [Helobdella robusta]|uniref:Small monomeric GTPase n=1 Tax=Helobdella robusta TaxID=6412 RepID=T1FYX5_HELRO